MKMALKEVYKSYLASASPEVLSDDASLHYITTLTTINTSAAIAKHNAAHKKLLQKKEEKILSCVEGGDAVCLDVETTLQFISGGGAYLPGLDDNFVSDHTVIFPMVCILTLSTFKRFTDILRSTLFNSICMEKFSKYAFTGTKGLF